MFAFGVSVWALQAQTQTTPIVFAEIAAPVERGLVASLAKPGGNVTGFTSFVPSLAGKWLGLLKELAPRLSRAAVMFNPDAAPHAAYFLRDLEIGITNARHANNSRSGAEGCRNRMGVLVVRAKVAELLFSRMPSP